MINEKTSLQLLNRIPLIYGKVPKKHYDFLLHKWGGIDGNWHSIKNTIKKTGLDISIEEAKKLELQAITLMEKTIKDAFSCQRCFKDLRKVGLHRQVSGYINSNTYLSENGEIVRTNNERFSNHNFKDYKSTQYSCLSCDTAIENNTSVLLFIKEGVNNKSTRKYMEKFGGVKEPIPITDFEKSLFKAYDRLYAYDVPSTLVSNTVSLDYIESDDR